MAYALVWFDKNGENLLTGGSVVINLGMLTYAHEALKKHLVEAKELKFVVTDHSKIQPGGNA